jgi:hypothetical protein
MRTIVENVEFERCPKGNNPDFKLPLASFYISDKYLPKQSERRRLRRKWCVLKNTVNKKCTYRTFWMYSSLKGRFWGEGQIVVDWDAWLDLLDEEQNNGYKLCLSISVVPWWRVGICLWKHPEPTHRWAGRISMVLGVTSLLLSLVSVSIALLGK